MKQSPDIRHWREIDAQYISDIFALNNINAKVEHIYASPVGTGKIGECVRFQLDLAAGSAPDAPCSLIGKFPADDDHSRSFGVDYGLYLREVNFYQLLQPKMEISTPYCYYAVIDENSHEYVLMLQDLAPAVAGNQLRGITLDEAQVIVSEAAKLHASFWRDETVNDYAWINNTRKAKPSHDPNMMPPLWEGFCERYGDDVTERAKYIGDNFCRNIDKYEAYRTERVGLMHLDFRPDNMLFAGPEGGAPLTVVDWQSITYGPVAADIGYCIAGALPAEIRREHEAELLNLYTDGIKRHGGGPYAPDDLHRHYVTGAYQLFMTAFSSIMMTGQAEESDKMFFAMLNGAVEFIYDHKAEHMMN